MSKPRLGILGGSFDPIHFGHLMVAKHCLYAHQLDEICFVPSRDALLKDPCVAMPWQRAAMVALAIVDYPQFFLSTCELVRDTPSYALLTLHTLRKTYSQHKLFWILGADAYAQFTEWHGFKEIATLCDLIVVSRDFEGEQMKDRVLVEDYFEAAGNNVRYSAMPMMNIASRVIRDDLAKCQSNLPESVRHFIMENGLYSM